MPTLKILTLSVFFTALLGASPLSLAADKGMLKIVTEPGDAKIYINGKRKGTSPAKAGQTFAIKLPEGEYKIEAVKGSGGPTELYGENADVFVAEDTMQTITIALAKRPSKSFRQNLAAKYANGFPFPKMVNIPAGSFQMGCVSGKDCSADEKPVHKVTLSAFAMSATEVTFDQWDACVADGGCLHYPDDKGWGRGNRPVMNVSWDDAQAYIKWLSKKTTGHYRLPTEAEWEYAARAGSSTKYSWGNKIDCSKAQYDGGENSDCYYKSNGKYRGSASVASFKANAFGLYDMHGNVWEWVEDWYDKKYYTNQAQTNPKGATSGRDRVNRGGSWFHGAGSLRAADRGDDSPGGRGNSLGFRIVRQP